MSTSFDQRATDSEQNHSLFDRFIRERFPGCEISRMPPGSKQDRIGIDAVVTLSDGMVIRVQEKADTHDTDRICLEWQHVDADGAVLRLGWMDDLSQAGDTLLVVFVESSPPYAVWLPLPWLRAAWHKHRDTWIENARAGRYNFALSDVPNGWRNVPGSRTRGVCVPRGLLYDAIFGGRR